MSASVTRIVASIAVAGLPSMKFSVPPAVIAGASLTAVIVIVTVAGADCSPFATAR